MSTMFAIGLHCPKNELNAGSVLRAADAFGASMVAYSGNRIKLNVATNVSSAQYRIPVVHADDLHTSIPYACIPIAVELVPEATDLRTFVHPRNAFYVFGAEDETLGQKVLSWCPHKIFIPVHMCLNLAACVNVVLYDRLAKLGPESGLCKETWHASFKPLGER